MPFAENRFVIKQRIIRPQDTIADIIGETLRDGASFTDSVWKVSQKVDQLSGGSDENVASGGKFILSLQDVLDNPDNFFPPLPFRSSFSTLFNGINQHVRTGPIPLDKTDSYSFSDWVKLPTTTGIRSILSNVTPDATARGQEVLFNANNRVRFNIIGDAGAGDLIIIESGNALVINKWTHVVCTYDGSGINAGLKIYIDGINQPLNILTAGPLVGTTVSLSNMHLGSRPGILNFMNGNLDEMAVYNFELSNLQVAELFNAGIPNDLEDRSFADPIHWWQMGDNDFIPIIVDHIGALNGTIFNGAIFVEDVSA